MPIPTGLFIESPEMNDVSLSKLNQDANEWPEEIVEKVKERIPDCNGMNLVVKFMKKDEENGAATGSVVVGSSTKMAVIPIIIKDFFLHPIDVMIADGKLLPLTPDYFNSVFQGDKNKAFQRLDEYPMYSGLHRFEDASLWQANYPPGQGRYAYASAGFDILDKISDTIDPTEFKDYLSKNPAVAANFAKHAEAKDLVKALCKLAVNNKEFRPSKDSLLDKTIAVLRLEGPNKYSILSTTDEVFSPANQAFLNGYELRNLLGKISDHVEDVMNEVDKSGEKMLIPQRAEAGPTGGIDATLDSHRTTVESANDFDNYRVHKKDGVAVEGVVIPTVIGFDMKKLHLKLFIGKTMATVQSDIAGVRLPGPNRFAPLKHDKGIRVGQTGTFVYMNEKHQALATMPVTIKMIVEDCGEAKLKVVDLEGRSFAIKGGMGSNVQSAPVDSKGTPGGQIFEDFQRIVPTQDGYILPRKFFWVPMEGFQEISSNPIDYMAKIAAQTTLGGESVQVISTGYGQYSMRGVAKYAKAADWDSSNLSSAQTKLLLASFGHGEAKIASVLKVANRKGHETVFGCKFPKTAEEVLNQDFAPRINARMKLAAKLRTNLVKEASYLENAQTVDALLSLNFINPDNLARFVGFLPRLKATISNLCSLLLASRLGVQEIPESACSNAMYRMVDVINGLEKLRAIQEMGPQE